MQPGRRPSDTAEAAATSRVTDYKNVVRRGGISRGVSRAYLIAEKRLSNEFDDTTGAEPESWPPLLGGGGALSNIDGFCGGRACGDAGVGLCRLGRAGGRGRLELPSAFHWAVISFVTAVQLRCRRGRRCRRGGRGGRRAVACGAGPQPCRCPSCGRGQKKKPPDFGRRSGCGRCDCGDAGVGGGRVDGDDRLLVCRRGW